MKTTQPARARQLTRALVLLAKDHAEEQCRAGDPIGYYAPSQQWQAKRDRLLRRRLRALGFRDERAVRRAARRVGYTPRHEDQLVGRIYRRICPW